MKMDPFLTIDDLIKILNTPKGFVYEHCRKGTTDPLPHFRFGKYLRFKPDEIHQWIEAHRKK
jgi:excisionase family DNA binding protein